MKEFFYILDLVNECDYFWQEFTRSENRMINELSLVSKCYVRYSDRMNKYLLEIESKSHKL